MLLNNLKKVVELDSRINDMHRQLANLYAERSNIVEAGATIINTNSNIPSATNRTTQRPKAKIHDSWASKEYASLSAAWKRYDIEIPGYTNLKVKLVKSRVIMDELSNAQSDLMGRLSVILVPPTRQLGFPINTTLRQKQGFCDINDYVNQDLPKPTNNKQWRVLVVYTNSAGLSIGSPAVIFKEKSYLIAGYDTRALGITEYAALTLQKDQPLDEATWTLLLKDYAGNEFVPSATCMNGRFRFDIDEVGGILENDCFRPAIEVL